MTAVRTNIEFTVVGGDMPSDELLNTLAELLLELVEVRNEDSRATSA